MRKYTLPLIICALIFTILACQQTAAMFETGEISFTSPASGTQSHSEIASGPIGVPVSIRSTFNEVKVARLFENDTPILNVGGGIYECALQPNSDTDCAEVPIVSPGVYNIRAEVTKLDGTAVSAESTYSWQPYSSFDNLALKVAAPFGSTDPTAGYGILFGIVLFTAMLLGLWLGKGSLQAVVLMIIVSLICLTVFLFSAGSAGGAYLVATGTIVIVLAAIVGMVLFGRQSAYLDYTTHDGDHLHMEGHTGNGKSDLPIKVLEHGRGTVAAIEAKHMKEQKLLPPHVIDQMFLEDHHSDKE